MTALLPIVVLAIVQGLTEFLPVSSSGHLVVVAALMQAAGIELHDVADVNIVLHFGTLLSILVFYWSRVWRLLFDDRRAALAVLAATIPAVAVGLVVKTHFSHWLENPLLAGCLLPVTGVILLLAARRPPGERDYVHVGLGAALLIGLAQAAAILPGISRSGATICTGLALGLSRRSAATFSFLMAIPVIAGASLLEAKDLLDAELHTPLAHLAVGVVVAFGVGYASLAWLVRWLEAGRLHLFAYWVIPLGLGVVAWRLWFAG